MRLRRTIQERSNLGGDTDRSLDQTYKEKVKSLKYEHDLNMIVSNTSPITKLENILK